MLCPFIEEDKLRSFVVKKSWLSVANDSSVGEGLGFVCGSRSIKLAREAFHAIEVLDHHGLWHRPSQNL